MSVAGKLCASTQLCTHLWTNLDACRVLSLKQELITNQEKESGFFSLEDYGLRGLIPILGVSPSAAHSSVCLRSLLDESNHTALYRKGKAAPLTDSSENFGTDSKVHHKTNCSSQVCLTNNWVSLKSNSHGVWLWSHFCQKYVFPHLVHIFYFSVLDSFYFL